MRNLSLKHLWTTKKLEIWLSDYTIRAHKDTSLLLNVESMSLETYQPYLEFINSLRTGDLSTFRSNLIKDLYWQLLSRIQWWIFTSKRIYLSMKLSRWLILEKWSKLMKDKQKLHLQVFLNVRNASTFVLCFGILRMISSIAKNAKLRLLFFKWEK